MNDLFLTCVSQENIPLSLLRTIGGSSVQFLAEIFICRRYVQLNFYRLAAFPFYLLGKLTNALWDSGRRPISPFFTNRCEHGRSVIRIKGILKDKPFRAVIGDLSFVIHWPYVTIIANWRRVRTPIICSLPSIFRKPGWTWTLDG